ncbi:hypothetical protein [Clostridium sporogenes]|uniref:hypothetical protein n=1 Tax=Clostridium sporogenes TaxID=1509 RepID=UPI00024BA622|nr:hypothetical protein [Clostridium sporogenes]EHN17036.1 hypothetical protein IYC_00622 [Clostridium sporogenes PA 3679]NFQ35220.1 hypothetical protein [Clostridium sporogenes]NFQ60590.1 hypothetical protein [Clostridium sporogenes]NFU11151.1 hypothetical protein [Clostridium sporogenes]NFU43899.1 hypothetical protein [Clostridium sporogenes]
MFKIFNKKRNNDKLNELRNNITINVPNDMGADEVRKEISKLSKNVLTPLEDTQRVKTKVIIELNSGRDFDTYSYDTVQEINEKLNSDSDFITIGDLVLKCESIESIWKTTEEYRGGTKA